MCIPNLHIPGKNSFAILQSSGSLKNASIRRPYQKAQDISKNFTSLMGDLEVGWQIKIIQKPACDFMTLAGINSRYWS